MKLFLFVLFAILALLVGLYPLIYFLMDRTFGLLASKETELLTNILWNIGFYVHILLGGLALFIGWLQFSKRLRKNNIKRHRTIGKIYIISALLSGFAGIGIGFFATGGLVAATGFISLGLIWVYTTLSAYLKIKNKDIQGHQKMMVFSYASCFAAVTLRLWLPILISIFHDFETAYKIVAWLCWIPNILFAFYFTRKIDSNRLVSV
ncbi:MAG: DUF2306 domain-containing protein [Proteobacteria bacterium]|nr:DUF2306 domain-containing protein [Pseudomonadota bacterium]